ncbi:MAG: histidine--tRNA ligase [Ignavibacteriales bacterium]|nr:histidine--tRNA ligase [Ignavibacteriales bacterium]
MKYRSIKGTKDLLPAETGLWHHVEADVRYMMSVFNYREIRTPVFEATSLFARSIGELTDIVTKEMYTFNDRGDESLTLRPEGTASVLRAYLQNNLGEQAPLTKLYYLGPMFRQERPQAGRLRQFYQFGAEAIGSSSPLLDVEMMILPLEVYRNLGINDTKLALNSVGCEKCRPRYKKLLIAELKKIQKSLSPDSQARLSQNPLRVLDSKDERDRKLTADVPLIKDHLCEECRPHFEEVQSALNALNISFHIDGRMVRGLDYYTKTAFEITHQSLGSQDALAGGGRYDLLIQELGGKATPAVGFAAGMERLMIVLEKNKREIASPSPKLYLAALDEPSRSWAFRTAVDLRKKGIAVETDYLDRSLKAQMRDANRLAAEYVVVIGSEELKSGSGKLKNMRSGTERPVSLSDLAGALG